MYRHFILSNYEDMSKVLTSMEWTSLNLSRLLEPSVFQYNHCLREYAHATIFCPRARQYTAE